jgi:hypothetical protein
MEIKIKTNAGQLIIKSPLAEHFKEWLAHECDGAEPTEELFEEFMWLEDTFREPLIDALKGAF